MAGFALLTIVVVALVIGGLAWRMVNRPIRSVLFGVRRLGAGNLSHRLAVGRRREVGELAELSESINAMAERLQEANAELAQWNHTLEERIREKTEQLERTRDQMVFAEKMSSLGKLAAIVAHELNNPLAGILVYTKVLRRRVARLMAGEEPSDPALPTEAASEAASETASETASNNAAAATKDSVDLASIDEALATIGTETARCGDIVKNLLLFSNRREAGFESTDLNALLERTVKLIQHRADLEEVKVRFDLDPNLPEIHASPTELQQAVLAVLINALEAMPDGGVLSLQTRASTPDEPAGVFLEISDTGIGIPEHLQARIFEPFFSTKEVGKATGLGLAVVYGIAERHGSRVNVQSNEKGTTFRIFLPRQPPLYAESLPELLRSPAVDRKDDTS
jgi:two-component system NtrC family sensor kinase